MKKILLILGFIILLTSLALILPDLVSGQAPPPPPDKPTQTPIDGGLGLLAAAGGAYAIKKLRDKKK